jgi:hypothetical protein
VVYASSENGSGQNEYPLFESVDSAVKEPATTIQNGMTQTRAKAITPT